MYRYSSGWIIDYLCALCKLRYWDAVQEMYCIGWIIYCYVNLTISVSGIWNAVLEVYWSGWIPVINCFDNLTISVSEWIIDCFDNLTISVSGIGSCPGDVPVLNWMSPDNWLLCKLVPGIGMLFKRLRVCWDKCQESTISMETTPLQSLIPVSSAFFNILITGTVPVHIRMWFHFTFVPV
jgi:hypothetical protein